MTVDTQVILSLAFALVAFLYASVGHAGASGYIAVMSIAGLAPASVRPIALVLNIFVASLATWQFWRAGHFSWGLFWPFAALSIPFAFIGGYLKLPNHVFQVLVGFVLLYSAYSFFAKRHSDGETVPPRIPVALASGALLGLLSGLTGTGGGIFLSPLLIFRKWARMKSAAAVSAMFILMNSISGLLGNYSSTRQIPEEMPGFIFAVLLGGFLGSYLGSQKFPHAVVRRLLAFVLLIAGFKLVLT